MKKSIIITIVVLALVALAAVWYFMLRGKDSEVTAEPPVPYVSDIINDSYSSEHKLVSGYDPQDRSKAIFVFGSRSRTQAVAGALMESDAYDNVDGSSNPDGLKDFAGETVCTVAKFSNFGEMVNDGRLEDLRELTTRNVLAAMDTLCFVSPYDRSGMGKKPLAKLIILGSACMTPAAIFPIAAVAPPTAAPDPILTPPVSLIPGVVPLQRAQLPSARDNSDAADSGRGGQHQQRQGYPFGRGPGRQCTRGPLWPVYPHQGRQDGD